MDVITDLFLDMLFVGNLLIVPFCLIPIAINFRYWKNTRIFDYFLIVVYFFTWSVLQGFEYFFYGFKILSFEWSGIRGKFVLYDILWENIFRYYLYVLDAFPLFIVAVRAKYGSRFQNFPNIIKIACIIPLFIFLLAFIDQAHLTIIPEIPTADFLQLTIDFNRIYLHIIIIYIFLTTVYQKTNRSRISRQIWIYSSLAWIFSMTFSFLIIFILKIDFVSDSFLLSVFFIPLDFGYVLLFINHIFYPEAVLFTNEQIGRALKLYSHIDNKYQSQPNTGLKHIKNYLDSLPEDIKSKIKSY